MKAHQIPSPRKGIFKELVASVKEAGKIRKGKAKPSRCSTTVARTSSGYVKWDLASMIGVSMATLQSFPIPG